jgi:hypothetical protein
MFVLQKDALPITVSLNGTDIVSKMGIDVLGVLFDSKPQWNGQVAHSLKKAYSVLKMIKLLKRHFTFKELLQLLMSNYFSTILLLGVLAKMITAVCICTGNKILHKISRIIPILCKDP